MQGARVNHDALDITEAHYELVISVDARRSGVYDDVDKVRMRERIYRVLETAFAHAKVARDAVHLEDRGDGVLLSVPGRIAASRLLGLWLIEVHEKLRDENRGWPCPSGCASACMSVPYGTTAGASADAPSTWPAGWPTPPSPAGCSTPRRPTWCW